MGGVGKGEVDDVFDGSSGEVVPTPTEVSLCSPLEGLFLLSCRTARQSLGEWKLWQTRKPSPSSFQALVVTGSPSPPEIVLEAKLSEWQEAMCQDIRNWDEDDMYPQLLKACNHPYLFEWPKDESGDPAEDGVLVHASGKMKLLDEKLDNLKEAGQKVCLAVHCLVL